MGEPVPDQPDGILLAVGGSPARADTLDVLRQAGTRHYQAVVVKARGEDFQAAAYEANAAGVCLLVTPDDMTWRQLDALITASVAGITAARTTAYAQISTGDLFALANAIACRVGGATTVEDPRGRVLAYSNLPHQRTDEVRRQSILQRQSPRRPAGAAAYERVCRAQGPVMLRSEEPGRCHRRAIAVRAGQNVLALLWVLDGEPALPEGAEAALEEAARITALHLLRSRDRGSAGQWNRASALAALLEGRVSERVAAEQLGIDSDTPTTLLAVARTTEDTPAGLGEGRVIDLVRRYCEALHPRAICTEAGEVVYALVPVTDGDRPGRRVMKLAEDLAQAVQRNTSVPLHIGIAGPAAYLRDVPSCRHTADRVLSALADGTDRLEVATIEHVHSRVVLLELVALGAAAIDLPADPVQQLIAYDLRHATTYTETLLAYLDAFGEASRAAAAICVHENTLRYRIRRLQELFALDLSDADTRLVTWLRLRLRHLDA
ncbi:helix-turn-helix domain-containing protein [Streptomyces sp. SID2888]|uniref:helix-turn-helix domain-containing protein n=1 Tax=Streptomyces sp. SID2888 TaxID=2690256 RepID=UPI00136C36C0|nr:PucR family transcriptional regulator [Streptomyces sp. SID2888]